MCQRAYTEYNSIMNDIDTSPQPGISAEQKPSSRFWKEFLKFIVTAAIIVLPIRMFVIHPFVVNGASMDPTFRTGQYLIVDQLSYRFGEPDRGDVVILKYPREPRTFFIKRIIGLPGETIEIKNGNVTIKSPENPAGFALPESYVFADNKGDDSFESTLNKDEYFVMGDNRIQSSDSRAWGALPRDLIVGRPLVRLFPLGSLSLFPGTDSIE